MELIYTNGEDMRFVELCRELDNYLNESVGGEKQREVYNKYNTLEDIKDVVLIIENGETLACGSFKEYDLNSAEIKRVFVTPLNRKRGLGRKIMNALEEKASQKGYKKLILETGKQLKSAQNMYSKIGFEFIPNYGQYENMDGSVCMAKSI